MAPTLRTRQGTPETHRNGAGAAVQQGALQLTSARRASRMICSVSHAGIRAEQHSLPFGATRAPVCMVAFGAVVAGARS